MVDLSTEWCYWCKVMDKNQFRDSEILALMNPKLNSYMLDAEKDSIGQLLKLKFGIASYPSFLFFTPPRRIPRNMGWIDAQRILDPVH